MRRFPVIKSEHNLGMMPVFSCTEYPWDPESSYMPFMVTRFAFVEGEGAVFDISSFDTEPYADAEADSPLDDNIVAATFNFFPEDGDTLLTIVANAFDKCLLYKNGEVADSVPVTRSAGEDERGIYWAVRIHFTAEILEKFYGKSDITDGDILLGNVFKARRSGPLAHLGAIAPLAADSFVFDSAALNEFVATNL